MTTQYEHVRPRQAWAHRDGKIDLQPLRPARWDPEALAARAQIAEAFYRFGIAWDETRIDVLCSCFVPDAVFESAEGQASVLSSHRGHDAMRTALAAAMAAQEDQRRHLMGDVLVEELDLAAGTARALAQSVVTATGESLQLAASVIYTAELRRDTDGCWRFSYFFVGMDRYLERA